jgi:hypothetical protein
LLFQPGHHPQFADRCFWPVDNGARLAQAAQDLYEQKPGGYSALQLGFGWLVVQLSG